MSMAIYEKDPLRTMLVDAAYRLSQGKEPVPETAAAVNAKALELFGLDFGACTADQKNTTIELVLVGSLEPDSELKKCAELNYLVLKKKEDLGQPVFDSLQQSTKDRISAKASAMRTSQPLTVDWHVLGAIGEYPQYTLAPSVPPSSSGMIETPWCYHHLGFDPSVSEDGYYYLPQTPTSFKQILSDWLSFFCVLFRSYFSLDP